jgi:hypothetical protein
MAIRSVATTDTLETFRTTFNNLGTDVGDLSGLGTTNQSSIVGAINEVLTSTFSFTLRDETSTTQVISANDTMNVLGDSNITATVSAEDSLTITLNSTISGLTSVSSTTLTDGTATLTGGSMTGLTSLDSAAITINSVSVATTPFAIAQAIALG